MFKKPTIFTDDSGSHVLGIDGSVKASFTVADHGASHEGAAISHLQQNFDDYMGEEAEQIDEISAELARSYLKGNAAAKNTTPDAKKETRRKGGWNAFAKIHKQPHAKVHATEEAEQTDEAVYNGHRPTGPLQGRGGLDKHHQAALDAKLKEIDAKFAKPKPIAEGQKPYVSTRQGHAVVLGSDGQELKKFTKAQHGASYMTKANAYLDQHYGSLSKQNEEVELDEAFFHYAGTKHPDENSVRARIKDVHVKLMKSGYRPVQGSTDHSKIKVDGEGAKYSKPGSNQEIHVTASSAGSTLRHNPSPFHVYVDQHDKQENKFTSKGPKKSFANSSLVKNATEEVKNPYAVGMAAAEKSTGDTPPLKKSTIDQAHKIAKEVMKENNLLTGALKKLQEGRGRPPKEGSAAWKAQQAAGGQSEDTPGLEAQLVKHKDLHGQRSGPIKFSDGSTHEVSAAHREKVLSAIRSHRGAGTDPNYRDAAEKHMSSSHENFKKWATGTVKKVEPKAHELNKTPRFT